MLECLSCNSALISERAAMLGQIHLLFREVDAVLKFLKEQCGAKRIGTVGFCWGGVATHYIALQYPEVKAGVSVYGTPSQQIIKLLSFTFQHFPGDSFMHALG